MRKIIDVTSICLLVFCFGCSTAPHPITKVGVPAIDHKLALELCARLKPGMSLAEVEAIAGPVRKNLEKLQKRRERIAKMLPPGATMTPDLIVSNGLVLLYFHRTATGDYVLDSSAPLPEDRI